MARPAALGPPQRGGEAQKASGAVGGSVLLQGVMWSRVCVSLCEICVCHAPFSGWPAALVTCVGRGVQRKPWLGAQGEGETEVGREPADEADRVDGEFTTCG